MALTGPADGPPLAGPCALVDLVGHAAGVLFRHGAGRGRPSTASACSGSAPPWPT